MGTLTLDAREDVALTQVELALDAAISDWQAGHPNGPLPLLDVDGMLERAGVRFKVRSAFLEKYSLQ